MFIVRKIHKNSVLTITTKNYADYYTRKVILVGNQTYGM